MRKSRYLRGCLLGGLLVSVCLEAGQRPAAEVGSILEQNTLSAEQRLSDLSKVWSEAKFSFAYYDTIAAEWDALYREFMPRVQAAGNDYEHYLELKRFVAHLRDGHSGVFWPRAFDEALGYPPVEIRKIEGRAVIFRITSESEELAHHGIRPGLTILKVDGQPVAERIAYWSELMCASTEQARDRLTYFRILTGPRDSQVEIVLEEPDGTTRTARLTRSEKYFGDTNLTPNQPYSSREPDGGIGYFRADIMRSPVDEAFAQYIERSGDLRGLVLDLRYNGGGSDLVSFDLISRLINQPVAGPIYEVTAYRADRRATRREQEIIRTPHGPIAPATGRRFTGWLVVLIGEQTHSAAEGGFLSVVRSRPRTLLMGEPTAGSTGQPLVFKLFSGGIGAVCSRRSLAPDGSPFVGTGFQPDVAAHLTRQDLAHGQDSVLDKALKVLRQKLASTQNDHELGTSSSSAI
jgi:C-terminal processing protease CtpA/Prc